MPSDDQTKQDLLAAILSERAKLDELFAPMDEAQMVAAARDDGWTAKDILAHISVWERRLLTWIDRWRATGNPMRPEPGVAWDAGDLLNDRDFETAEQKSVADIRSAATGAYNRVLAVIDTLTDDELAVRPEEQNGPSWSWIAGANTYEHYKEHREEMEAWLSSHAEEST